MSDKPIVIFGDIVEANGQTICKNNETIQHKFVTGQTIYCKSDHHPGAGRIMSMDRDCDGTTLYTIQINVSGISENNLEDYDTFMARLKEILDHNLKDAVAPFKHKEKT